MGQNVQLQVPFTGGPDQGQASEYLDPQQRILAVSNGRYIHDGSVEKRWGVRALTTSVPPYNYPQIAAPLACFTRAQSLLATDGDGLYVYSLSGPNWANVGGAASNNTPAEVPQPNGCIPACTATRAALGSFTGLQSAPSAISYSEGGGVGLIAFQGIGAGGSVTGTFGSLIDVASGAIINANAFSGNGNNPIGMIISGYAYFFFSDSSHIYWQQINLATGAFLQGILVSDAANNVYDATPETNGSGTPTGIVLAYNQSGHSGCVRYLRLESLPALTITASGLTPTNLSVTNAAADAIAVRVDEQIGAAVFVWENAAGGGSPANNILAAAYNVPAWTQINLGGVGTALSCVVPGYTAGGSSFAGMLQVEPLDSNHFLLQAFWGGNSQPVGQSVYGMAAGAQVQTAQYPYGFVAGRPFRATVGDVTRCYMAFASYQQVIDGGGEFQFCTVHLMDTRAYEHAFDGLSSIVQAPRIVATLAPRQADQAFYSATMQISAWRPTIGTGIGNTGQGVYKLPIGILASAEWQTAAAQPQPVILQTASFNFGRSFSYCDAANELFMAGGVPSTYAGSTCNELSFHRWPSGTTAAGSTGGALTTLATYGYAVTFAEVDATGLVHRSVPYTLSFTLSGSDNQVILTVPSIPYTQRGNVVLEFWRTTANAGAPLIYYFVGSRGAYGSTITSTLNFTDSLADTAIASNATLPTTGGVLPSQAPPSFQQIVEHKYRLFGIDDTGLGLYFSTPMPEEDSGDAPLFNDVLTYPVGDRAATAIWSMDDKLFIFTLQGISYIEGDGPNNLGIGSDYPASPIGITTDVGCIGWQSIAEFPGGLLFQAPDGSLHILGRDLSVTNVLGMQDTISTGVAVLAASTCPRTHDIRLLLSTGAVVSYDYVRGRWATLTYPSSGTLTSAIVDNGQNWTACSNGGNVWQEKTASSSKPYMDTSAGGVNSWVTLAITSAWVKVAQLQGYQRLRNWQGYGTILDPCDVSATVNYDYGVQTQGPATFTYAKLSAANPVAAQWEEHSMATAGQAMSCQMVISDAPPTGGTATTGQGCRFLGMNFDLQVLGGRTRKIGSVVKA